MKFKTLKTSETGIKFQKVVEKKELAFEEAKKLSDEIGFEQWRPDRWVAFGGVEFVYFKDKVNPDQKIWKDTGHGLQPKGNTKAGKEIQEKFKNLTVVDKDDLNQCIGFNGAPFKCIGFSYQNPDYFLFSIDESWKCQIPDDCQEITVSEYRELSKVSD